MAASVFEDNGETGCKETVSIGEWEGFELSRMIEGTADAEVSWMIRVAAGAGAMGAEMTGAEMVGEGVAVAEVAWTIWSAGAEVAADARATG